MNKKIFSFTFLSIALFLMLFSTKTMAMAEQDESESNNEKELYLIVFKEKSKDKTLNIKDENILKKYKNFDIVAAYLTSEQKEELKKNPNIKRIFENRVHKSIGTTEKTLYNTTNPHPDGISDKNWGYDEINVDESLNGESVKIAIDDSGIRQNSAYSISGGASCFYQWNTEDKECREHYDDKFYSELDWDGFGYLDKEGHGTGVAGITSSRRDNENGLKGIAPNAGLYALKNCREEDFYDKEKDALYEKCEVRDSKSILDGIDWLIENKIDVVNMSYVYGIKTDGEEGEIIKEVDQLEYQELYDRIAQAYKSGVYFVASAGNNNRGDYSVNVFPSRHPLITTVTGVGKNLEGNLQLLTYSSRGPEVDITAPGYNIYTVGIGNKAVDYEIKYGYLGGTSLAAPFVTGTVALAKEKFPNYSNDDIYSLLMINAKPVINHDEVWDEQVGYGLIQANFPKKFTKNSNKVHLNKAFTTYEVPKKGAKTSNAKIGDYDSSTMYKESENVWYQIPSNELMERNKWIPFGKSLIKAIPNRAVLDEGWATSLAFNGKEDDGYTKAALVPGKRIMYRFEKPVKPKALDIKIPDDSPSKKADISLYNENRELVQTISVSEDGVYDFNPINEDVYYFEIKNTGDNDFIIGEFDLLGDEVSSPTRVMDYKGELTVKKDGRAFFDNADFLSYGFAHWGILNKKFIVSKAAEWNDVTKQYDKVMVSNDELGIQDKWINVEEGEMEPVYKNDLTSIMYGQVVKDKGNGNPWAIYDDAEDREVAFVPNQANVYEFDNPVSVSHLFIKAKPNYLDNQAKITLTDVDGNTFVKEIGDDELFYRYFSLDQTYSNIKKVSIENTNTKDLTVTEMGIYGQENENRTFPAMNINHQIWLNPYGVKLYDEASSTSAFTMGNGTGVPTEATATQGYGFNALSNQFDWMQINCDGAVKWVKRTDGNEFPEFWRTGLIDSAGVTMTHDENVWWQWSMIDNGSGVTAFLPNGSVTFKFNNPVSVQQVLITLGEFVDNNENKLSIELLDANEQVIYQKNLSREDLYKRIISLDKKYDNVDGFRIKNFGTTEANINELDFK